MPSSYVDSIAPIVKVLQRIQPKRILDVGPGWGKYGLMALEYLPDLQYVDAVEVPDGRLRPGVARMQDVVYDRVWISDIRDFAMVEGVFARYDLVMMIDVIEHLEKEQGQQLVDTMLRAGCDVLVSTPKLWQEQHDDYNPHEEHVSHWEWNDFPRAFMDVSTIDSIIFLMRPSSLAEEQELSAVEP